MAPIIDLSSEAFQEDTYTALKAKFTNNLDKFPDVKKVDQFLYIRTEHPDGNEMQDKQAWKLWVPETLREEVLGQAHDSVTSSHAGMQKTIAKIRRNLFWPGLSKDVRDYIRSCDACKENKAPNYTLRPPMGEHCPTYRPFQSLYIDLLGPYPRSLLIGLLSVLGHFSKNTWLQPLKKFTSAAIIEFLTHNYCSHFSDLGVCCRIP